MSSKFNVYTHRNSDNIHLKLVGDFDGSSAWQLIETLKQQCLGFEKIFVHTSGLSSFHPFGREVFQKETKNFQKLYNDLVITGEYGKQLMSPGRTSYSD